MRRYRFTESGSIQLESGTVTDSTISYILNETDATDADRPFEGDAIYHPALKKLFQINFVDHDDPFNQLDNNPVYKMRCRLFDYSSDEFSTGITEIDAIADESINFRILIFSLHLKDHQLLVIQYLLTLVRI